MLTFNLGSRSGDVGTEISGTLGFVFLDVKISGRESLDVKISGREERRRGQPGRFCLRFCPRRTLGKGRQEEITHFLGGANYGERTAARGCAR